MRRTKFPYSPCLLEYNASNKLQGKGDSGCTHTMYGKTEDELLVNAKKHGILTQGYT